MTIATVQLTPNGPFIPAYAVPGAGFVTQAMINRHGSIKAARKYMEKSQEIGAEPVCANCAFYQGSALNEWPRLCRSGDGNPYRNVATLPDYTCHKFELKGTAA